MITYNPETKCFEGRIKSPYSGEMLNVHCEASQFGYESLKTLQIMAYVMIGGGMIGDFAMRQPADFYIDDRVGRLPYARGKIYQVVNILAGLAQHLGLDPHNLERPKIPSAWVF